MKQEVVLLEIKTDGQKVIDRLDFEESSLEVYSR